MHPAGRSGSDIGTNTRLMTYITATNRVLIPLFSTMQSRCDMRILLLIVVILLLIGALPTWPYSGGWGYYPSGGFGLIVIVLLILLLLGRI
jgi:hypothetical protein